MQEQTSLKGKTVSGLFWSFSDLVANQGIQFIIQIILARVLLPKDFGIIGIITIFISISQSFIDSGFSNALIREEKVNQEDYSTVFYFNLIMAILMYCGLFFSAKAISSFFKEPQLIFILRVVALVLIINSFGLIQRTMLMKKIDFKTQTRISLVSSIGSGFIGIVFAYLGYGVWSLVIRIMFMQIIQSLLLCLFNKWVPSLVFKVDSFKRLFGFGWKILISGLINTLYENLYLVIIGSRFSALELGYYTNASKLRDIASQSITTSVQKVSYPVLSSIKEDVDKVKTGYRKIIKNSVFITFPIMIGLSAISNTLTSSLFGNKWLPSSSYFQVLCFAGMLYPLHAVNLNILQVKGRSDLFLGLEIIKKLISLLVIAVVLIFKLGIEGLLWGAVLNSYSAYFINSYFSADLLSYSTKEQIKDIMPIFTVSILMGVAVLLSGMILPHNNFVSLMLQIIIGCLSYTYMSNVLKFEELNTIYQLLSSIIKKLRFR